MTQPISALPTPPTRTDPATFSSRADAFMAALPTFVSETNAVAVAMNLNETTATSTTSDTIAPGSTSLTVTTGKGFLPGMSVKIARTSSPSNWMHGDVTSYNSGTGALVVNVTNILGSGTYTDWTITYSSPIQPYTQEWQVVTGSRVSGTIYTNNTSQRITVMINATATVGGIASINPAVGGLSLPLTAIQSPAGSTSIVSLSFMVPPGATYQAIIGGSAFTWAELR